MQASQDAGRVRVRAAETRAGGDRKRDWSISSQIQTGNVTDLFAKNIVTSGDGSRRHGIHSNFKFHSWAWGLYNFAFSFEIDVVRLHHDHQSMFLIQVGLASKTINLMDFYQHYPMIIAESIDEVSKLDSNLRHLAAILAVMRCAIIFINC